MQKTIGIIVGAFILIGIFGIGIFRFAINDTPLIQEVGGSGVFYYAVVALNTVNGYVGSDAVFLGDCIAPQTIEIGKGNVIIVNYAERANG